MKQNDIEKRLGDLKKQARSSAVTAKGLENLQKLTKKAAAQAASGVKQVSAVQKEIRKLPD